jgi:hypothetical protein
MPIPNAQTVADRWAAAAGAGGQRYADGVASTTVDVVGRAIAALPQAAVNYQNAINTGHTARRLAAVGTQGWKAAVAAKGAANYATGINASKAKYQNRMGQVLQVEAGLQQSIQGMPSGTPAASDARMLAWSNGMRQAKANGAFD